jgi:hypothetical protein
MYLKFCALVFFLQACNTNKIELLEVKKIEQVSGFEMKGISFVGMDKVIDSSAIQALFHLGCNWITQMPYGYCNMEEKSIVFCQKWQWWGESDNGIIKTTHLARTNGIKTMLKPQLWMDGKYTGSYTLQNDIDWVTWENEYENFILHFAKLADSLNIEMFCIGTELDNSAKIRPQFWENLIDKIKITYSGKLVYAANWSDYQNITFWNKLDYIGIDAYFPLSEEKTPKIETLKASWEKPFLEISEFQKKIGKPVLFTEIGYKSVDQTAKSPWFPSSKQVNYEGQKNAISAFFEVFSNKDWFHGAFFWKWYPDAKNTDGNTETDYTPQNKPAEKVIKHWYGK